MKPDIVFRCKKCEHLLFVDKTKLLDKLPIDMECPECGEEPPIWLLEREGNYDKEFG